MIEEYVNNFSFNELGLIRRAILNTMKDPTLLHYEFDKYADLYYKVKQLQYEMTEERK